MKRVLALSVVAALGLAGCSGKRYIDFTLTNHTGAKLDPVEVDYPGGSFGAKVEAGNTLHYRFKPLHDGTVQVIYGDPAKKQTTLTGPALKEEHGGTIALDLQPDGPKWQTTLR